MVSGDVVKLQVGCEPGTKLFIGSQSNARIFKTDEAGSGCSWVTEAELQGDSTLVYFAEPIVMHENSAYNQVHRINMQKAGLLVYVDWLQSGRSDNEERFKFLSYESEVSVDIDKKMVLRDTFRFRPTEDLPASPTNFGHFQSILSAYICGDPSNETFRRLNESLKGFQQRGEWSDMRDISTEPVVWSFVKVNENVSLIRALAESRADLRGLCRNVLEVLADNTILGFNPSDRRY